MGVSSPTRSLILAAERSQLCSQQLQEGTRLTSDLFTNCCRQLIKLSSTSTPPARLLQEQMKPSVLAFSSPPAPRPTTTTTPPLSALLPSLFLSLPHHLLSSSHLPLRWLKTQKTFMEESETPRLSLTLQPFCGLCEGAQKQQELWSVTFQSRCPDTENWSSCAGRTAWFLPGLGRWRCAKSSQCRFLPVSKVHRNE